MPAANPQPPGPGLRFIRQIPNALTVIRLLLAVPIGLLIFQREYALVLTIAFVAGLSDGVDGWIARRFNATSRFGSVVDPVADKILMLATFIGLASVDLLPWWLALLVIGRDLLIVGGVLLYRHLTGRIDMEPSRLSKFNTVVQIGYTLSLLLQQVWPLLPEAWFDACVWLVAGLAVATAADYILTGVRRTRELHGGAQGGGDREI
jgi:cardiolipin synthase